MWSIEQLIVAIIVSFLLGWYVRSLLGIRDWLMGWHSARTSSVMTCEAHAWANADGRTHQPEPHSYRCAERIVELVPNLMEKT
jgi:hypothetical protein